MERVGLNYTEYKDEDSLKTWKELSHWISPKTSDPNTCLLLSKFVTAVVPRILRMTPQALFNYKNNRSPSFQKFIYTVLIKTRISPLSTCLSLYYINRLMFYHPNVSITNGCECRLLTTGLILANKFLDDKTFCNRTWADITKISIREINIMEREFLTLIKYYTFVNEKQLMDWIFKIESIWKYSNMDVGLNKI
jgi:hypothetical protein